MWDAVAAHLMSLMVYMKMQAEFARVPLADTTVVPVHDSVTDIEALMLGDILPTGMGRRSTFM